MAEQEKLLRKQLQQMRSTSVKPSPKTASSAVKSKKNHGKQKFLNEQVAELEFRQRKKEAEMRKERRPERSLGTDVKAADYDSWFGQGSKFHKGS